MSSISEKISLFMNRRFLRSLARDPGALRFFLNSSAQEEANGEGQVFDRVKPFLDGQLAKLVETHSADEVRHEKMILAELERLGGKPEPLPEGFSMVDEMSRAAGGIFDKEIEGPEDVAKAYFLLYAIERRAIERFTLIQEALAGVHPRIAETYAAIAKDERVHLRYCVAVTRAMVPDDAAWTRMRDEFVDLEARVFSIQSSKYMGHQLDNVFTTLSRLEKFFWKRMRAFSIRSGRIQYVLDIGGAQELPSGRVPARSPEAALAA